MPILDRQRRTMELGRIRTGQVEKKGTKSFPSKLDRFRVTGSSKPLLERVAELYGGSVQEWTPQGGLRQYEVVTESDRLPILVPPQPVTQWMEFWSGGGCQRRCDGEREQFSDSPCLCKAKSPEPTDWECKPTTRLNVMLRDVEGVGLWRLESHGWYAASELPELAELLARAGGYLPADLVLQQRKIKKRDEKYPREFAVPVLEVHGITPGQLMSGARGASTPELAGKVGELESSAPEERYAREQHELMASDDRLYEDIAARVESCRSVDDTRALWQEAQTAGVLDGNLREALKAKASGFSADSWGAPDTSTSKPVTEDLDSLWMAIMKAVPENWTSTQVEADFLKATNVKADAATAEDMRGYLDLFST